MTPDEILVGIGGIGAILLVGWFFFGKQTREVADEQQAQIVVDGGYLPEVIHVKQGQPVTLNFLRKDPSGCLEEVALPDFGDRRRAGRHGYSR